MDAKISGGLALLVLVLSALVVAGCGGPSAATRLQARQLEASRLAVEIRKREAAAALKLRRAEQHACTTRIGAFLTELEDLNSHLDVGLSFADYGTKVGDARSGYDRIPANSLSGACLTAGLAGEDALNSYVAAYNVWNTCVQDINCSTDSIDPSLQGSWATAGAKVIVAKTAYFRVGLDAVPNRNWTNTVPATPQEVRRTVYGRALLRICTVDVLPAALVPCGDLRSVLAGGVATNELSALDKSVKALNQALGLDPSTP